MMTATHGTVDTVIALLAELEHLIVELRQRITDETSEESDA